MLIARRLRELGVYCDVCAHNRAADAAPEARGVILSGGPASVFADGAPQLDGRLLGRGVPVLGICYGMHALALHEGGEVCPGKDGGGYGLAEIVCSVNSSWLNPAARQNLSMNAWVSHGDQVGRLPAGFIATSKSASAPVAAMENRERGLYAVQFHPEVAHTEFGAELLGRFCTGICGCATDWTMPSFAKNACRSIRAKVGRDKVLLGMSGGVDSAVTAALVERAVPGRLECVMVDNGLLREGEAEQVSAAHAAIGGRLRVVGAQRLFFNALAGVTDPEQKRKIIGAKFIEVFERTARELGGIPWLAQGTIYPDVVESAGAAAGATAAIKAHHNVGGLPARLGMGLVEPLRLLFKDEVRMLGEELGLPAELLARHPFPGPGMAVRVLGEVTEERVATARRADGIFLEELRRAGCYGRVAQAFAVLLPLASVGVMGDARTYENVVALRAVTTEDFMTADWARLPNDLLSACARRIANEVRGVSRVVYDVSSKPPATVEWE